MGALQKLRSDVEFAFQRSGLPLSLDLPNSDEAGHGFITAGDDNLLSGGGPLDQAREIGFGMVHRDDG